MILTLAEMNLARCHYSKTKSQASVLETIGLLFTRFVLKVMLGGPRGRVVKVADFSALDHSIISPMWVRASHGARIHM